MQLRERLPGLFEGVSLLLLLAAFITIQVLIGGTRMVFSLPAYLVVGAAAILTLVSLRVPKPGPCRVCLVVTALAFAYILGRALLSPAPYITRSDVFSALAALAVYFAFAVVLTGGTARMWFLTGLLVFALGHIFVGAIQFRDGTNFMPISWLQRYDYGTRASGFYVCPNHLAGLLEVIGVIGLSVVCWSRWPGWAKLLLAYVVACCYIGVIITGSRGGYLSAGASLVVFAVLSLVVLRRTAPKLFWKVTALSALAAIVLGGAIAWSITNHDYLSGRAQAMFEKTNIRRDLWRAAIEQWKINPAIGTGSATYLYYGRYFRMPGMQRDPVYVHNDYLQLLAEYGIVGAAAMGLAIVFHVRRGLRSFSRLGPKRVAVSQRLFSNGLALNIGALAAVAAYAVHEALDFNLHIPANALLLAFVFGILANDGVVRDRQVLPVSWSGVPWRLGLAGLAVLLVVQSARLLPGEYFSEKARVAVRDNRAALAISHALRGLRYDPTNPDLYYHLGCARMLYADFADHPAAADSFYADAIDAFEKARALAPQDEIYALELATALDAARRFEEAEWRFQEAMALDPKSESLRRYYAGHLEQWRTYTPAPAQS